MPVALVDEECGPELRSERPGSKGFREKTGAGRRCEGAPCGGAARALAAAALATAPRDTTGTTRGGGWGPTWPVMEESGLVRAREMGVRVDRERWQVAHEEGCGRGGGMGSRVGSDGGRKGRWSWLRKWGAVRGSLDAIRRLRLHL
jgi:hypothetical protein